MEKTIDQVVEETRKVLIPGDGPQPEARMEEEPASAPVSEKQSILDILMLETGPGDFKDPIYINHPFNFNNSEAMARIIRGLTGIVGELRLAIVDIIIGSYQFFGSKDGA